MVYPGLWLWLWLVLWLVLWLWGGGEGGGRIKNLSTNPHRRTTKWVTEKLMKAGKWLSRTR